MLAVQTSAQITGSDLTTSAVNHVTGLKVKGDGDPIGTIKAWPSSQTPDTEEWLECDGSTFDKDQYPELFAALGSTTLPDYKGQFLRGGSAADAGKKFEDTIKTHEVIVPSHTHTFSGHLESGTTSGSTTTSQEFTFKLDNDVVTASKMFRTITLNPSQTTVSGDTIFEGTNYTTWGGCTDSTDGYRQVSSGGMNLKDDTCSTGSVKVYEKNIRSCYFKNGYNIKNTIKDFLDNLPEYDENGNATYESPLKSYQYYGKDYYTQCEDNKDRYIQAAVRGKNISMPTGYSYYTNYKATLDKNGYGSVTFYTNKFYPDCKDPWVS